MPMAMRGLTLYTYITSAESQTGAIADQRCSVESQKGAIAIDFVQQSRPSGSQLKSEIFSNN